MGKPVMQFTVWVNGKQNSEKVNFLRNSVYHVHKPVPFKGKRLRKPETGMISNTTFSIEHEFLSGKTALPFQIFPCSWQLTNSHNDHIIIEYRVVYHKQNVSGKSGRESKLNTFFGVIPVEIENPIFYYNMIITELAVVNVRFISSF